MRLHVPTAPQVGGAPKPRLSKGSRYRRRRRPEVSRRYRRAVTDKTRPRRSATAALGLCVFLGAGLLGGCGGAEGPEGRLLVSMTGGGPLADAPSVMAVTLSSSDGEDVRAETEPPSGDADPAAALTLFDRRVPIGRYEVRVTQDECGQSCEDDQEKGTAVEYCRIEVAVATDKDVHARVLVGLGATPSTCETS